MKKGTKQKQNHIPDAGKKVERFAPFMKLQEIRYVPDDETQGWKEDPDIKELISNPILKRRAWADD